MGHSPMTDPKTTPPSTPINLNSNSHPLSLKLRAMQHCENQPTSTSERIQRSECLGTPERRLPSATPRYHDQPKDSFSHDRASKTTIFQSKQRGPNYAEIKDSSISPSVTVSATLQKDVMRATNSLNTEVESNNTVPPAATEWHPEQATPTRRTHLKAPPAVPKDPDTGCAPGEPKPMAENQRYAMHIDNAGDRPTAKGGEVNEHQQLLQSYNELRSMFHTMNEQLRVSKTKEMEAVKQVEEKNREIKILKDRITRMAAKQTSDNEKLERVIDERDELKEKLAKSIDAQNKLEADLHCHRAKHVTTVYSRKTDGNDENLHRKEKPKATFARHRNTASKDVRSPLVAVTQLRNPLNTVSSMASPNVSSRRMASEASTVPIKTAPNTTVSTPIRSSSTFNRRTGSTTPTIRIRPPTPPRPSIGPPNAFIDEIQTDKTHRGKHSNKVVQWASPLEEVVPSGIPEVVKTEVSKTKVVKTDNGEYLMQFVPKDANLDSQDFNGMFDKKTFSTPEMTYFWRHRVRCGCETLRLSNDDYQCWCPSGTPVHLTYKSANGLILITINGIKIKSFPTMRLEIHRDCTDKTIITDNNRRYEYLYNSDNVVDIYTGTEGRHRKSDNTVEVIDGTGKTALRPDGSYTMFEGSSIIVEHPLFQLQRSTESDQKGIFRLFVYEPNSEKNRYLQINVCPTHKVAIIKHVRFIGEVPTKTLCDARGHCLHFQK